MVRPNRVLKAVTPVVFFSFFFISFLQRHVYNNDFWWHLATGKYIVESKCLPQKDPFSYTTSEMPSTRKSMILKGNWLSEAIFYQIYSAINLKGIIFLRAFLMLFCLYFVFLTIKKQRASDILALVVVTGVFVLSTGYLGERPQLFTFFFFSLVLYLLEDFRMYRTNKMLLIPVLMLVLSNMHPGYIVCTLLISIYLVGEMVDHFFNKNSGKNSYKRLLAVWFIALLSVMLNPNGLSAFREIFSLEQHVKGIVEFMPTFSLYARKVRPLDYSYIIFLLISLLSFRYAKKIGITQMLLLIVFTVMSFVSIRYVIFYMFVSAPVITRIIIHIRDEKPLKKFVRFLDTKESYFYFVAFFIGAILILQTIPALAQYKFKEDVIFSTPKGAADFLSDKQISGNMFNEYGYGGYLIWRLYPGKKVFIDGRSLEPEVNGEYKRIISDSAPSWEGIFKKYDITYIVMPPLLPHGEMYPIVEELFDREDWILVYYDQLSLIFVRKTDKNISILKEFAKDKTEGFRTIIFQASARAMKNTTNPYYLITLGKLFFKMGKFEDAEKAFLIAYQRDPNNPIITEWLKKVQKQEKKGTLIPNRSNY